MANEASLHDLWQAHKVRFDAAEAAAAAARQAAVEPYANPTDAIGRASRHDGWTPDRQKTFLEAVAEGFSTERACQIADMSPSSAHAFKKRAAGQAFALGWRAAQLLGRDRIADRLLDRAMDGFTETVTRANDDVIERHRFDNRMAMSMLARLDRQAEGADAGSVAANTAARMIAAEFDAYLDLLDTDNAQARAGLFLARRSEAGAAAPDAVGAELGALLALTRADRFARTGAALASEVDVADLDPADRAGWTADQWQRADAAGLVVVAGAGEDAGGDSPLSPLVDGEGADDAAMGLDAVVVWHDGRAGWRTSFPPPPDFDGVEQGAYGDYHYSRDLSLAEHAAAEGAQRAELDELRHREGARRGRWFRDAEEVAQDSRTARRRATSRR